MADRKKSKQKERLLREEVAAEGNVIPDIGFEDEKLQRALHSSREEAQFARAAREGGGGQYEHNGGSSQQQGGLVGRLRRSSSQRAKSTPVQTRIDTDPWSMKGKHAKTTINKACAKFFRIEAIPGVKADNPYFMVMVKELQRLGKQIILSLCLTS
jgi:hypothetical protein